MPSGCATINDVPVRSTVIGRGQSHAATGRFPVATPWSVYRKEVVPTSEALQTEGLIGAWGITGVGVPAQIIEALRASLAV